VFLNTRHEDNLLADSNPHLISLFSQLKEDGEEMVQQCKRLFTSKNNREHRYYELREEFNTSNDPVRRSSLFVYLNRHCYNGLCRFNKQGKFNTPFGQYERPYFPEQEMLAFAEKLQSATAKCQDFRLTIAEAGPRDVVYCDPPYVPLSNTANFTDYAAGGFSAKDHQDLAALCVETAQRGASVLISNHDTPFTRNLYHEAKEIVPVLVSRTISCNGENRKKARELIAVFSSGQARN